MNKKLKFITGGIGAVVLAVCLICFGKDRTLSSTSAETDEKMVIFGTVLLVAGVVATTVGFTSKEN